MLNAYVILLVFPKETVKVYLFIYLFLTIEKEFVP